MDVNGQLYKCEVPGRFGGNRKGEIYGKLDCTAAMRAIKKGGYVNQRVFFADEHKALAAGYRPCGTYLRRQYIQWKENR
ncbi:metal-binding protein [Fictibacillus arsenicus]|uniref:Metal-binding protein n=2 Tax=Fictibacillus arsenicus TaxID=255247 RepID=A0A1B1Z8R1_9BACL|nr:metal-binding protein [Fictibacillus arsenicus]